MIAAVVTLFLAPGLVLIGGPPLIGAGLLTIAVQQQNRYLGVWAVVYGVVGCLEAFYVLSNRLYDLSDALGFASEKSGYFSWSSALVFGVLGLMLVGAGLVARRRELVHR